MKKAVAGAERERNEGASGKPPWYIDLLNVNLDNHDMVKAKRRLEQYMDAFAKDGTRITQNLDFEV